MKSFLLFISLFSLTIEASEVPKNTWVKGRSYLYSCSYYSNTSGDYEIYFRDRNLPWGTKVSVVLGFSGYRALGGGAREAFEWDRVRTWQMKDVAPYTWYIEQRETLHSRSSNQFLTDLNFVFKIEIPNQAPYYENGGSSYGYHQVFAEQAPSPCVENGSLPPFKDLEIRVIKK